MKATRSFIYEGNIKARFPVNCRQDIVMQLHYQLQQTPIQYNSMHQNHAKCLSLVFVCNIE